MEDTFKKEPIFQAYIVNADDTEKMFSDLQRLQGDGFPCKWQAFPTTKEEIQATLQEIGVDGLNNSHYFINNYKSYTEHLNDRLPIGAGIDEINYLAVKLNEMNDYNHEVFDAVMCTGKDCNSMTEIIRVAENIDTYDLQPVTSAKEYGEFLVEKDRDEFSAAIEWLSESNHPADKEFVQYIERLERNVDFIKYGHEAQQAEKACLPSAAI